MRTVRHKYQILLLGETELFSSLGYIYWVLDFLKIIVKT